MSYAKELSILDIPEVKADLARQPWLTERERVQAIVDAAVRDATEDMYTEVQVDTAFDDGKDEGLTVGKREACTEADKLADAVDNFLDDDDGLDGNSERALRAALAEWREYSKRNG